MKMTARFTMAIILVAGILGILPLHAQPFTGSNVPGTASSFSFSLNAGATNASIIVPGNATAYSHLLIKKGTAPSDSDYDFISAINGQTNTLHLEAPELSAGTYFVRVRTPATSQAHNFTVLVQTNLSDMRSAARPVSKKLGTVTLASISSNERQYFRFEKTENLALTATLDSNNSFPDLYLQRNTTPTDADYLKRSLGVASDLISLLETEASPGVYFIGVFAPNGTPPNLPYTLRVQSLEIPSLTWDPGLTHEGTMIHSNFTGTAGDYYFRITTANPALAAWRIALKLLTNDAQLYLSRGSLPTPTIADYRSERAGSDGFVLGPTQFNPNEEWYLLVRASANARWTLVSGAPFVQDLGTVTEDGSSGSGPVEIGPEGIRFFRATAPANMLAWRLWLNGQTNQIFLKKTTLPVPAVNEQMQAGQTLVVPPYLSGNQQYLIGVSGAPGTNVTLDSRHQPVVDIAYGASASSIVTGFGYTTYRIQVPPQQIAWQLTLPSTNGNPNFAVRRNTVPNENSNEAFSELTNAIVDNISLVPPVLSDGTFYVTVYGSGPHHFILNNGPATVTDINYVSNIVNTDTNQVGWRYFRVTDINQQLGTLGWELLLTNFAPGTRIALRRNAAPSIWSFRTPTVVLANYYDFLSTIEVLQNPGHQADIWYVGVYQPTNALGAFALRTREIEAPFLAEGVPLVRTNRAGLWDFFRIDVPSTVTGSPLLGWDLRLTNVTRGYPNIVVRRERLPVSVNTTINPTGPSGTNWPGGGSWAASTDWTSRSMPSVGGTNETGRILAMGMGRPLEPGVYYVGVISSPNYPEATAYTLLSRWIGSSLTIPVPSLAWSNGSVSGTVSPREAKYYQVTIPPNKRSWKVRLNAAGGEVMLAVSTNRLMNVLSDKRVQKVGREHYVMLPLPSQDFIPAGTAYFAVVGEGLNPPIDTRIGTGDSSYVLETLGEMTETELGLLTSTDIVTAGSLEGGESAAYHFATFGSLGFWLTLENRVGNPVAVSRGERDLADPGLPSDLYGNEGGEISGAISGHFITVANPFPEETIMVKARSTSPFVYPDASYTLRVQEIVPQPIAFDGGITNAIGHDGVKGAYFAIDVPPGVTGWDIRLTNVTSGTPQLVVARDFLPIFRTTSPGFLPQQHNNWPIGDRWAATRDWTERTQSPDGSLEDGRILAMGMGRPLQPGRYYASVLSSSTTPMSYTLVSRGIGVGRAITVTDLAFNGGTETVPALAPREAAYYRIEVPAGVASWKVRVTTNSGEIMLVALKDTLPNVLASSTVAATNSGGHKMQKVGDEFYVMLPPAGSSLLPAGTYYLAVVGEGIAPAGLRVGTGVSGFTVQSLGAATIRDLGQIGFNETVESNSLPGGDVQIYQFTVPAGTLSMEARLTERVGNPVMTLKQGTRAPSPGATGLNVPIENYGNDNGEILTVDVHPSFISVPNPSNSVYTLVVMARSSSGIFSNASYNLRLNASGSTTIDYDGGTQEIANHAAQTWKYFRITVPTNALGWDVRVMNVATGMPRLVIRRESLPNSMLTAPWSSPGAATAWPTNNQWAPGADWTRRSQSASNPNLNEDGRVFACGIGRPLEPGTYFVGVFNTHASAASSYTFLSRGIGTGFSLPVIDVPFVGSATNLTISARDAAYFRVFVPSNVPSWKVKLTGVSGESMLVGLRGAVPNIDMNIFNGGLASGKGMQKLGNDHYILLPATGFTNIIGGTNYFAVIGEGVNPPSSTRIGAGNSSIIFESQGTIGTNNLGLLTSEDILLPDAVEGGETKLYQFLVPPGTLGFRVRLENRVGNPTFVLRQGDKTPDPGTAIVASDAYGSEGGYTSTDGGTALFTMPNPIPGVYTLAVKGRAIGPLYPDASYTIRLQEILVPEVNFSADLNTNGLVNSVSGLLEDNERIFFKINIPSEINGQPVIGWKLDLVQSSGLATMRVRRDILPADANAAVLMPFTTASAIIVPPFLTNGTWYVEVKGAGSTAFTLTSAPLQLERPVWTMPAPGETNQTRGVVAPLFADSAIDTNGAALPEESIFLQQGFLHYYAITVPGTNYGLLRAILEAFSGNPDLYLRQGAAPTLYHNAVGSSGTIFDRAMLATGTEYANWVPFDGRTESKLKPGLYFLAVRAAGNANARYRLKLSVGNITDLPVNGPEIMNQLVAGGDWRYYRFVAPSTLPGGFNVTFGQQSGDVIVHLRDTLPPGITISGPLVDIRDWANDAKNQGPYANYGTPGTFSFLPPVVRPGHVYYLGIRSLTDSTFSIQVTTNGAPNQAVPTIAFYGGTATTNLQPGAIAIYRVDVPAEATRWKHVATHVAGVSLHLEQGTLPTRSPTDDWRSSSSNSFLNQYLLSPWPWVPNQSYYLLMSNSMAEAQDVFFAMDGKNAATDDNDSDGLPDAWELQYFGTVSTQIANGDPDRDGVTNLEEYFEDTNPNDIGSFRPRLFTFAFNGTITRSPNDLSYPLGSEVVLTAVPSPGYAFVGWTNDSAGLANPLVLTMNNHKTIRASFKLAGDDFITALPLSGSSVTAVATNVGMSKEPGEPNHAGNPGGKSIWWRWTAPSSGSVTITTAGSAFNTLLGVYTGQAVFNLSLIASDNNSGGTSNRSRVTFNAVAGTTYNIAVDGVNGASSRVNLSVNPGGGTGTTSPQLRNLVRLVDGRAQFTIIASTNRSYSIQASENLSAWIGIGSVTTDGSGTSLFIDSSAPNYPQRFYRVTE